MKTLKRSTLLNPPLLIGLVVLLFFPQAGSAQVQRTVTTDYDAVRDFSIISNPNGAWSYGWMLPLGSPLNLYTVTTLPPLTA